MEFSTDSNGGRIEVTNNAICEAVLLDVICYEKTCGRLSPEMEYLFERHLEQCPSCRRRILGFRYVLDGNEPVRNFG